MLSAAPLFLASLLLMPSTPCDEVDSGGFETWEDYLGESAPSGPESSSSRQIARSEVVGQPTNSPVPAERVVKPPDVTESHQAQSEDGYVIWFGAGASWMMPLRLSGGSNDSRVLSEFSVSWAPFGIPGEIGVDLLMNRNSTFLVRPNLKFFFVKHKVFSFYFEGSCAILSAAGGTHVGGGGGLGVTFGLMDHLALELRAVAVVLHLPGEATAAFAGVALEDDETAGSKDLMFAPSIGARITARF